MTLSIKSLCAFTETTVSISRLNIETQVSILKLASQWSRLQISNMKFCQNRCRMFRFDQCHCGPTYLTQQSCVQFQIARQKNFLPTFTLTKNWFNIFGPHLLVFALQHYIVTLCITVVCQQVAPQWICVYCAKKLTSKKKKRRHIKQECEPWPNHCMFCGRQFTISQLV